MYCTQKSLQQIFDVGQTFTTRICRLIDEHEDRYENLGKVGGRYSAVAFADAYVFREKMENGEPLPKFMPETIKQFLAMPSDETKRDYYEFGFRRARQEIYNEVKEYFDSTMIPDESKTVAKCIRRGVLAAITEVEDDTRS